MGRVIIEHIDDARYIRGEPRKPGDPITAGCGQLVGDLERGPWIHINTIPPNKNVPLHSHTISEVMYVIEGELSISSRKCGPGTVIFIDKETQYGFKAGPHGVRVLNIRQGLAALKFDGKTDPNPYANEGYALPDRE